MRPIRLTMQAFGPFARREVIDFTNALDAGLFGIYGQTGAGKSSIFNAMTFALFGQTLRTGQKPYSLRSDQADATVTTQVELVFDIGDKRYVALRTPEQMRPKQRGEGETKVSAEAHLFDATGLAPSQITEAKRGKVLVEKKVKEVGEAIIDLLGYGLDQFRQIVLLPQGQFEKFLSAGTKDRAEILEDLFDVSLYERLATTLKEQAKDVENQVQTQRAVCASRLESEGFEGGEALKDGINTATETVAAQKQAEAVARTHRDAMAKLLNEHTALNKAFEAAENARQTLATLDAKAEEMAALQVHVTQAQKAQTVLDAEAHARTAKAAIPEAEHARKEAEGVLAVKQQVEAHALEALTQARSRTEEITALTREFGTLERHQKILVTAEAQRTELEAARLAEQTALNALEDARNVYRDLSQQHTKRQEQLSHAERTRGERYDIESHLSSLSRAIADATRFENQRKAVEEQSRLHQSATAEADSARKAAEAAKTALDAATEKLTSNHARLLAAHLEPGAPCPVCGSEDHPNPARGDSEGEDLEAVLATKREAYDRLSALAQSAASKAEGAAQVLSDRQKGLADLEPPNDPLDVLQTRQKEWQEKLEALGPAADIDQLTQDVSTLAKKVESTREQGEALREAHDKQRRLAEKQAGELNGMLREIPEDLRAPDRLARELDRVGAQVTSLKDALERAEQTHQSAREATLKAQGDLKTSIATLDAAQKQAETAWNSFLKRLADEGLTESQLAALKPAIQRLDEHRARLEAYKADLQSAKDRVRETSAAIADKTRPDLATYEAQLNEAETALAAATDSRAKAEETLTRLTKLKTEIEDTLAKLAALEAETAPLRTLAMLCNGGNDQKMDLKTFAIAAHFDRVLEAANQRLYPMSGHRYLLERETESRGGGRKGLELQVSDAHTGKPRSTATLSGGETFIAALALALGLADTVESSNGKVRLDTIFIDEGFGSLDTENGAGTLDQVLQTLTELVSQNRAVGLISHVPLVQDTIPNGFYVRKQPGGSTIEERGIR